MEDPYFDYYSCNTDSRGITLKEYKYRLKIIHDLTYLCICPICGAPDCGDEKYIWAEFDDVNEAIHFGGSTFGGFLDNCWHYNGITPEEYQALPKFIRENNECSGWADSNDPNYEIDALDFMEALELVKRSVTSDHSNDFIIHYYPVMKPFVERVIKENKQLNILD